MPFELSPKQKEANKVLASSAKHILLVGGARSGKTFLICRALAMRAMKAPESRHVLFRLHFNHVKTSVGQDTFPKMMRLCFPSVKYQLDKSDWLFRFSNKSELWLGGLDDKDRVDKILGHEYATIGMNECSQIGYDSAVTALTRLAQKVDQVTDGKTRPLPLKAYYDLNPRTKAHWTYKLFINGMEPSAIRKPVIDPQNYAWTRINPVDNAANLPPDYITYLQNMPARMKKRFFDGEYSDANSNALWTEEMIDNYRVYAVPDGVQLVRVAVAIDPSAKDTGNEAGIIVGALGSDGRGYVLEDLTLQGRPSEWARVAVDAFKRHNADRIVAEDNNGGQMVEDVILAVDQTVPVVLVHASRGKITRAEPVSALYEKGFVSHVGSFPDLEDEMCTYAPPLEGETLQTSPNRMDALVWLWTYLLHGAVVSFDSFAAIGGDGTGEAGYERFRREDMEAGSVAEQSGMMVETLSSMSGDMNI